MNKKLLYLCIGTTLGTFLVRYLFFIFTTPDPLQLPYPDEANYYIPAAQMLSSEGAAFFKSPRSLWNGPLNPLWIALFHIDIVKIKIANLLAFSVGSGLLTAGIAKRANMAAALLSAATLLLFEPTYTFVPTLLTEPLYVSLLMISFGILLLSLEKTSSWIYSGLILGLATLVRPTSQLLPFFLIAGSFFLRDRLFRKRLFLHSLSALCIIAPLCLYNYSTFHKAGIANGFGAVFYLGNDFRRDGDEPVYSGVDFDTFQHTVPHTHLDTEGDRILTRVALERIKEHPADFLWLTTRKVFRYLFGSGIGYFYPHQHAYHFVKASGIKTAAPKLLWGIIQITASLGALYAFFSFRTPLIWYITAVLAYFTALHALTFPIPRLILPLFPYLITGAAIYLSTSRSSRLNIAFACSSVAVFLIVGFKPSLQFPTESTERTSSYFAVKGEGAVIALHDVTASGGTFVIGSHDPFIVFSVPQQKMNRIQVIKTSFTITCPDNSERHGVAQVFWGTIEDPNFSEGRAVSFQIRSTHGLHILRPALSPVWQGTVNSLRLDLPSVFSRCLLRDPSIQIVE